MGTPTRRTSRYIAERTNLAHLLECYAKKQDLSLFGTIVSPWNLGGMVMMTPSYEGPFHFRNKEGNLAASLGISARDNSEAIDTLENLTLILHHHSKDEFARELWEVLSDKAPPYASWKVSCAQVSYLPTAESPVNADYMKLAEEQGLTASVVKLVPWKKEAPLPHQDSGELTHFLNREGHLVAKVRTKESRAIGYTSFLPDDKEGLERWRKKYDKTTFNEAEGKIRATGEETVHKKLLTALPQGKEEFAEKFLRTFPNSWNTNPSYFTEVRRIREVTPAEMTHFLVLNYAKF